MSARARAAACGRTGGLTVPVSTKNERSVIVNPIGRGPVTICKLHRLGRTNNVGALVDESLDSRPGNVLDTICLIEGAISAGSNNTLDCDPIISFYLR